MDTFVLIIALGIIALVAIGVLVYRNTKKEVKEIEHKQEQPKTHEFAAGHNHMNRRVAITAAMQHHEGEKQKVTVDAAPMPDMSKVVPKAGKGIEQVLAVVMNPMIRVESTGRELIKFEPPLEVTVWYTEAEVNATTMDENGRPRLSLLLAWEDNADWKWERLKTHVEPDASGKQGTLSAKIHTLHPNDPLIIGRP